MAEITLNDETYAKETFLAVKGVDVAIVTPESQSTAFFSQAQDGRRIKLHTELNANLAVSIGTDKGLVEMGISEYLKTNFTNSENVYQLDK